MKSLLNHITKIIGAILIVFIGINSFADDDPFIQHWLNGSDYTLTVVDGSPWPGQDLAPASSTEIGPNTENDWVLFNQLSINITSADGTYIGTADVNVNNGVVSDKNELIQFTYNDDKSYYEGESVWDNYRFFDLSVTAAPDYISNKGWSNGLGNNESDLIAGDSYWGIDFNPTNWSIKTDVDGEQAAFVSTKDNGYGGRGGRSFPFKLEEGAPNYQETSGIGDAKDGLWQIDMQIGSNGDDGFCETFYLAERNNLSPGTANYMDGSGDAPGGNGREIDIMETKWKPEGPQLSLSNTAGGSGWSDDPAYSNLMYGKWSDEGIGGAPNPDFVTYGAFIRDNNLWIYAYKPDGTQWFCTDAIPNNNPGYVQTGDFVPYIGTWQLDGTKVFETGYKNFIYLSQDDAKIVGKNPKDNPESFGPNLK